MKKPKQTITAYTHLMNCGFEKYPTCIVPSNIRGVLWHVLLTTVG